MKKDNLVDKANFNNRTKQLNQGDVMNPKYTMKKPKNNAFDRADLCIISDALLVMCDQIKVNIHLFLRKMGSFSVPLHPLHAAEFFLRAAHAEWEKDACGSLSPRIVDDIVREALTRFGTGITSEGLELVEELFQDWSECLKSHSEVLSSINSRLLNFLDLCSERLQQYERVIDGEGDFV